MTGTALVRLRRSMLMELRAAWGSGRRVVVSLDSGGRLEGFVTAVAATGVFVKVNGRQLDPEALLAVHLPSRLGDSSVRGDRFHGEGLAPVQLSGQLALWDGVA